MSIFRLGLLCMACMVGGVLAQTPAAPAQTSAQARGEISEATRHALAALAASDTELKALEACVGAEQARVLRDRSAKRTHERTMKVLMDPVSGLRAPSASGTAAAAEVRYNECIKRENPDLQVVDGDKPMPCAAESALLSEARKLAGQEVRSNVFRDFLASSLPVMQEERAALIAELKLLCAANPAK